ncbi:MAG: TRAP transporter small permease [Clostridiales Family XIII bacterium]|nr:TRAP transporter small permease [Clostridiales Family XIII bacterium]
MAVFQKTLNVICEKLSYVSMAVCFFMMIMTTVDVILRKVSARGINGSYELTEIGMVALVFCAMAFLQMKRGQVRVDMFVAFLPARGRHFLEGAVLLVSTVVVLFMAYAAYLQISQQLAMKLTTSLLHIPVYPFVVITCVGLLLYAVGLFANALEEFVKCAVGDVLIESAPDGGERG